MSTIAFLQALKGKDVEFLKKIEDYEWYAEAGMRGTVTEVVVQDDDPNNMVVKVCVSFAKFDEFNKRFETANYWGTADDPTMRTARKAGLYKVEDWCYLGCDAMECIKSLDEVTCKLLDLFAIDKEAQPDINYVQWLEALALAAMPHLKK